MAKLKKLILVFGLFPRNFELNFRYTSRDANLEEDKLVHKLTFT